MAGPRRNSKAFPKAKLAPKKNVMVTVWWSTTAFWIRAKPLYLRSMLSKSMRCTENCNTCRRPWSTEWTQFFSVTMTKLTAYHTISTPKVKWIGLWSYASSAIFTWPLTNWLPLLQAPRQLFAGETPTNEQDAENVFYEFIKRWSMDFYAKGINKFISRWQKHADCNGSLFNKDVLSLLIMI